jgi:nucleoside-diphosphate-sugar epimerase
MSDATSLLVIGAGYVGALLATRAAMDGRRVTATTRDGARRATLEAQRIAVFPLDLAGEASLAGLVAAAGAGPTDVCCLLTPGAFTACGTVAATMERFVAALAPLPVRRAVLSSSTGVYGDCAGETVSAETSPVPNDDRSSRLLAIEQAWRAAPFEARVVRLAGLYGPGRIIGLESLRRGETLPGDGQAWLNLIHQSDAAKLLLRVLECDPAAAIELGSDGTPVRRADYYGHLAARAGCAAPRFGGGSATRGGGSRRCDPASTWARLGWRPEFADYRAGIAASLPA